ncbi:MAG: DUF2239 family protein [Lysobacterales bacterium]
MDTESRYTCFAHQQHLGSGNSAEIARLARLHPERPLWVFDDATGRPVDLDLRAREADIATPESGPEGRGRGRPRLGVIAREVTLLPRHWDWLATQRGGASVALRKLIDEARRANADADTRRRCQDRCYHFMSAIAGDLPGFEEAIRALYASDQVALLQHTAGWPADIVAHLQRLLDPDF